MNALLSSLAKACKEYPIQEKFLVVPNLLAGYQLMEALAREGVAWVNLRPVTPLDLARSIAEPELIKRGISLLTEGQALCLVEEALSELKEAGKLVYFASLSEDGSLARMLYGSLMEMRLARIASDNLDPAMFVDLRKGQEMKELLSAYEGRLRDGKWADAASIYFIALESLDGGRQHVRGVYLIPEGMELPPMGYTFLKKLTAGCLHVLKEDPVFGLRRPPGSRFAAEGEDDTAGTSSLSWLYRPGLAPGLGDPEMEIFQAYGAANEVREVFRLLKSRGIPLDRALLCYTRADVYVPLIISLCARLELPVTFAEGIPITYTRPGRLILGILQWIEDNYQVSTLRRVLSSGDMQVPAAGVLARLLRRAGIGWGRERYLSCLEAQVQALALEAEATGRDGEENREAYLKAQQEHAQTLKGVIEDFLGKIPASDHEGFISMVELTAGLQNLVSGYARISGVLDGLAREAVERQLEEGGKAFPGKIKVKEALGRLRHQIEGLVIGASRPLPGHLHVVGFHQAGWDNRPHTFVVGLDAGSFPGSGLQDPVLLDAERMRINPELSLRADSPATNQYRMAGFLASRRGKLVLSFSCYEVVEARPSFPSSILLQVYRLASGDHEADYSTILRAQEEPRNYVPEEPGLAVAEEEWWMARALKDTIGVSVEEIRACYPGLDTGLQAVEARNSPEVTAFDGKVTVEPGRVDPRVNPSLAMSATQMEHLARCPFGYFLRYILRVEPPQELSYDPGTWLDALTRGSLLHKVYYTFLRECNAQRKTAELHKSRLMEIAEELIISTREQVPPPSQAVFEYEREQIMRELEVFWRVVQEETGQTQPLFFEIPFGFGVEEVEAAGFGMADPLPVTLRDGRVIRLRGRIDRLDKVQGHAYHVWDYKTGGTYEFDEREFLKQGRQVQHSLYSWAAEEILRITGTDPLARVVAAGYLFPTEKGEGQRYIRLQLDRDVVLSVLELMLDILTAGAFCATDDQKRCSSHCDYRTACRSPLAVEQVKVKLDAPELVAWKELQQYD